ncbi:MAG: hypothetical protein GYB65_04950 [Chloroflexi bacterium]|nr:hypothetical protein [Chloroflexota bacterium]
MQDNLQPEPAETDNGTEKPAPRPLVVWGGRLGSIVFGLLLAWFLVELLLRLLFFSLPPRLQLILDDVRVTPFTDKKLLPDPIWQDDNEFLTITRPVQDREQYGSADVHFSVTTEQMWDSRLAFRTTSAQTDMRWDGVAVGDSFTFCFTEIDDCWVTRFGEVTGRNIINLGITGTGAVSHLRVMQQFGLPGQPPLVLWQWYCNDANEDYGLARLDSSLQRPDMPPLDDDAPAALTLNWWDRNSAAYVLIKMLVGADEAFEASWQFLDREHAQSGDIDLSFGRPYLWGAFDMDRPQNVFGWGLSRDAMLAARDELARGYENGSTGTLLIVLMPTKEQVYRDLAAPLLEADQMALLDTNYQMMLDFCTSEGLWCVDPLPTFQQAAAAGEQLYYKTDIHLNPRGNEVLAEFLVGELTDWLEENPTDG